MRFDEPAPMTAGLEEEPMVLDAATLDLAARAAALFAALERSSTAGIDSRLYQSFGLL